jgi:cell wall-associated NlpC family hydrolase
MTKYLLVLIAAFFVGCGSPAPRPDNVSDGKMNDLVMYAMSLAETPYQFGGNSSDSGFDCSGYVGHVFRHELNVSLPRTSREISRVGVPLSQSELRPGDLVFYNTLRQPFSHVGIYVGAGKFVHSPKSGDRIRVEQMQLNYWMTRFNGARRIR